MTRIFQDDGSVVPVSVIEATPNTVTRLRSVETDGYAAVQLGGGTALDVELLAEHLVLRLAQQHVAAVVLAEDLVEEGARRLQLAGRLRLPRVALADEPGDVDPGAGVVGGDEGDHRRGREVVASRVGPGQVEGDLGPADGEEVGALGGLGAHQARHASTLGARA